MEFEFIVNTPSIFGDINEDWIINIIDILFTVNLILSYVKTFLRLLQIIQQNQPVQ